MLNPDTLENYEKAHQIEWASELPEGCPPADILVPEDEVFYRFTLEEDVITEKDFKSNLEKYPNKPYRGQFHVWASGLSLMHTDKPSELWNHPGMQRHKGIVRLILGPDDGVLMKTGEDKKHYTWWRTKTFDITSATFIQDENS